MTVPAPHTVAVIAHQLTDMNERLRRMEALTSALAEMLGCAHVSVTEAARRTKLHRDTISRYIREGAIATEVNAATKQRRIRVTELVQWLPERTARAATKREKHGSGRP